MTISFKLLLFFFWKNKQTSNSPPPQKKTSKFKVNPRSKLLRDKEDWENGRKGPQHLPDRK